MKPLVSVVIPNWNGRHFLEACLASVKAQTYPHIETIVVDNGSADGSVDYLRTLLEVTLVELDHNYGFAGGVNRGLAVSHGDFIALLNNDAEAEPGWLEELVQAMEQGTSTGMVTAKILNIRGRGGKPTIDSTGDYQSTWGLPFPRGRGEEDHGQYDDKTTIFSVSGGASLYRRSMLEEVGTFDERYFAYYEDVDLSFRAQLAGYTAKFAPQAVVYHHIGGTSGGHRTSFTRYHATKNLRYLYLKNMPFPLVWKYAPRFFTSLLLSFISSIKHGFLIEHLRAIGAVAYHLPGILADRWRIQRRRKVSASYIDSLLFHGLPPEPKKMLSRYLPFLR